MVEDYQNEGWLLEEAEETTALRACAVIPEGYTLESWYHLTGMPTHAVEECLGGSRVKRQETVRPLVPTEEPATSPRSVDPDISVIRDSRPSVSEHEVSEHETDAAEIAPANELSENIAAAQTALVRVEKMLADCKKRLNDLGVVDPVDDDDHENAVQDRAYRSFVKAIGRDLAIWDKVRYKERALTEKRIGKLQDRLERI